MKRFKRFSLIVVLFSFLSVNSFAFFGLFGGGDPIDKAVDIANMTANVSSEVKAVLQLYEQIQAFKAEADRWKELITRLDPSNIEELGNEFFNFAMRYKEHSDLVQETFKNSTNLEAQFYKKFGDYDSVKKMDMKELNASRAKTKELAQESVKDSAALLAEMTGSKSKNADYAKQQKVFVNRLKNGSINANTIAQTAAEAIVQTNSLLLDMKSMNESMLQQTTFVQQEEIQRQKIADELARKESEKSQKSLKQRASNGKKAKPVKY